MNINYLNQKYGLFLSGKRRLYKENLYERDYSLEFTVPEIFKINGVTIEEHAWTSLLSEVAIYLHRKNPTKDLLEFKVDWGNMNIFVSEGKNQFAKFIAPGIYLYATFTAQHSLWILQDLLAYFDIDLKDVELIVHRNPGGEPMEVREEVLKDVKADFKQYLIMNYSKTADRADKIIKNIESLNKIMLKTSKSFDDLFLFDSAFIYGTYKARFKEKFLGTSLASNVKNRDMVSRYLDYLTDFYRDFGY